MTYVLSKVEVIDEVCGSEYASVLVTKNVWKIDVLFLSLTADSTGIE